MKNFKRFFHLFVVVVLVAIMTGLARADDLIRDFREFRLTDTSAQRTDTGLTPGDGYEIFGYRGVQSASLVNGTASGSIPARDKWTAPGTIAGAVNDFQLPGEGTAGKVRRMKYLLLDSRIVDTVTGAELVLGKVTKHKANPMLTIDKPWEVTVNNLYPNVLYDEQCELYRCWYLVYGGGRYDGLCYAESSDGVRWNKPNLELVDFNGSRDNNLIRLEGAHGVGIFLDRHEIDPARRYKMFFNMIVAGGKHGPMGVCFSRDGIHWSEPSPCPEIAARGDTHNNALWAPTLGTYVGITRTIRRKDNTPIRQVAWTSSKDFFQWTTCKVVLEGVEDHLQVYSMPVFYYGGVYLGLPTILNTRTRRVQTELAWSPDTVAWHRVRPGTPLIPNAATRDGHDWGMVFSSAYPIFRRDEIRLYYGGGRLPHRGKYNAGLCLATLRPDGFAGYEARGEDTLGLVTTRSFPCAGTRLHITADAEDGRVRVGLLDDRGQVLSRSEPITSDVTDAAVKWRGESKLEESLGKKVRLRFELENATIYAFSFGE